MSTISLRSFSHKPRQIPRTEYREKVRQDKNKGRNDDWVNEASRLNVKTYEDTRNYNKRQSLETINA